MKSLKGHRVYLDTSTIIYAVEGTSEFSNLKVGLLQRLDDQELIAVTSEITLSEALVGPRRALNAIAEQAYRNFLTPTTNFLVEPISRAVLEKVIELRAAHALKTPDAIHLATGLLKGCDLFVTGDQAWTRIGVNVVDPSDVG